MNSLVSTIKFRVIALSICACAAVASTTNTVHAASDGIFASGAGSGARLVINRSPNLGKNVTLRILIDGQSAGAVSYAQRFDRYITPGRRVITVEPRNFLATWSQTVNLRAGQTYSYTTFYKGDRLILNPGKNNPAP